MPPAARLHPVALLILLAAVLAAPASAELIGHLPDSAHVIYSDWTRQIDFNAYDPGGEVIGEVQLVVNPSTTTTFTLWAYNQEITGEINRTSTGGSSELVTYRIGDQIAGPYEASGGLFGILDLGPHTYKLRYGAGSDGSLRLWLQNYNRGMSWDNPVISINDVAYRVSVTSTDDVEVTITTAPSDDMHGAISEIWDLGNEGPIQFIAVLRGLFEGVYLIISLGWYVFKIAFIDNLLLFFGLFEAVGLAYATNKSRDIFQFYRRFADYNAKAFRAMVWLIEKMVTILTRIIDAINPIG